MAERIAQIEAEIAALKAAAALKATASGTQQQPQLQLPDVVTQQQQYRHTSHVTEQRLDLIDPRPVDPAFTSTTKTYITCPFHEKDEAKALGARWDMDEKRWFVPEGLDLRPFAKWNRPPEPARPAVDPAFTTTTDTCISCPFHEKDEAKALGARWDGDQKRWFVPAGLDLRPFAKWMREREAQERRAPFRPTAPSRFALAPIEPPPPTRAAPPGYVTHDRYGNLLAKPRPPTAREKRAATMGKAHCNSAETHAALTAAIAAGVELPKGKKRPRKRQAAIAVD